MFQKVAAWQGNSRFFWFYSASLRLGGEFPMRRPGTPCLFQKVVFQGGGLFFGFTPRLAVNA
jgi:hypothetical protein